MCVWPEDWWATHTQVRARAGVRAGVRVWTEVRVGTGEGRVLVVRVRIGAWGRVGFGVRAGVRLGSRLRLGFGLGWVRVGAGVS